ncbi:alpha/beta hydrolase [Kribbella sandramycini]|uniref:Alpha/beta hydrolase n=1 Tax=Kribbella sandramycini TaxID=60450 RepID=A0A7Y4P2V6_9ACTN|nr:alpha/beta hydrolase [Kribbella sandramycini]MBB6570337.1 pimeloyl-ACP methyl ester carboxylesterase [Kribbella sandramycini]NOL45201.1 alpha/beta hydrolase [Kribbella sandramycini]
MSTHPERLLTIDDVALCAQAFGDPADPPVLLVAGTSCSMDWWTPDFCRQLAGHGYFVVRFDQRDTGRSTHDRPGEPSYTLGDLTADAVRVLDGYGLSSAHWVGFSQGGWIAQLAALDHPDRVRSLALLSTRPTGHGPADADLPEVSGKLMTAWQTPGPDPDWDDVDALTDYLVDGERLLAAEPFDDAAVRAICRNSVTRGADVAAQLANHPMADQGPRWRERLAEIAVPTLVLHGSDDPLFPPANGRALAAAIPNARFQELAGVGHELPARVHTIVIDALTNGGHLPEAEVLRPGQRRAQLRSAAG